MKIKKRRVKKFLLEFLNRRKNHYDHSSAIKNEAIKKSRFNLGAEIPYCMHVMKNNASNACNS